ncbi:MAG: BspA family leucine-rich repeat surface protein [Prevotella sp.]|nr:BspA family leucine-rich repeat surface protein [Prevotella sp.]
MKQKLFTLFATLLCSMFLAITHAQAAQVYTVYDASTKTLTYYYDNNYDAGDPYHELYDPVNNPNAMRFTDYYRDVEKAVVDPSMKKASLTSMKSMFYGGYDEETEANHALRNMTVIEGLENLNTSKVTNMESMFEFCKGLTSLDLRSFNTAKVKNMARMFRLCSALTSLDLSSFNTANVENMASMFYQCSDLTSLSLSSFNTAKVKNMELMFAFCSALKSLDIRNFNVANVTKRWTMFERCLSLNTIYCSNDWSDNEAISSRELFEDCTSLVGGKGTVYDESHTDLAYAHPDEGTRNPGYFTLPTPKVYTVYDASTQTLTYYYDNNYDVGNPYHEFYDPVNNPKAVRFNDYAEDVKKAVIDPSMKNAPLTSMENMFYGRTNPETNHDNSLSNMESIEGLENLNTANVTSMRGMFEGCSALTSLNLRSFNTIKVEDMARMFVECAGLTSLDLSNFITSNVKNMAAMFGECKALTLLDLSSFDTSNVESMVNMFYGCEALTSLDISNFNVAKVTTIRGIFSNCKSLKSIYCSNDWSDNDAISGSEIFDGCTSLAGGKGSTYDISHINIAYARPDEGMRRPGYFTLPAPKVYTAFNETTQTLTYYYNSNYDAENRYHELYDPANDPGALRFMDYSLDVKKAVIDGSMNQTHLSSMENMFYGGDVDHALLKMTAIEGLENLQTARVTNMEKMFYGCYYVKSLDLSSFNTANVENMSFMFFGCASMTSLDISSFNTANVKYMENMFYGCLSLPSLDLRNFNIANVENMAEMFGSCTSLHTIYCRDDWSENSAIVGRNMFDGCTSLVGGKETAYDKSHVDLTYARPDGGTRNPGYFTLPLSVYTVYDEATQTLTYYFDENYNPKNPYHELYDPARDPDAVRFTGYYDKVTKAVIDPSMMDATLTSMENMFFGGVNPETFSFYSLSKLKTIEGLENLNTFTVTNMRSMFTMCLSLTSLDLSSFNTKNVTDMNSMFFNCSALQTVDVSSFDVRKVTNMGLMFASCSKLTTIYCNSDWSTTSQALTNSYMMFSGCNKIVGGMGTTLIDDGYKDATYARPDGGLEAPGYFTIPATLKGDADGDGKVTSADIVAMTDYIMGNTPAGFSKANADVNLDGVIDIADIVAVSNIIKDN